MAVFNIAVVKGGDLIEVDTDKLPEGVFEWVVLMGLKHFVNAKMTKVTKAALPNDADRQAEAMKIAAENVQAMYDGTVRDPTGLKTTKAAKGPGKGAVNTLAMQEARIQVKAEAKRQGFKVSHIEAKEITRLAKLVLEDPVQGPPIIAAAEAKLAAREATGLASMGLSIAISDRKVKQATGKAARAKAKDEEEVEGLSVPKGTPPAHVIATQRPQQPGARR